MTDGNQRQYSDEELLDYLAQFHEQEGLAPTWGDFGSDETVPSPSTYSERFGSWSEALDAAGLSSREKPYSKEGLMKHIVELADGLDRPPSSAEIEADPERPSPTAYYRVFGSWAAAIEEAGFDPMEAGPVDGAARGGLPREFKSVPDATDRQPVTVAEGATVEATFPGSPGTVRAIQTSEEWGVVATDVDPTDAVAIEHMAPTDGSTWTVLRALLLELADADCQPTQMLDYLAIDKCGIDPSEWAQRRDAMTPTVEKSAGHARTSLDADDGDATTSNQS